MTRGPIWVAGGGIAAACLVAAAVAAVAVIGHAGALGGAAVSSAVVPQQTSGGQAAAGAGPPAAQSAASAGAASSGVPSVNPGCAAAPSVQINGRALAATGLARVEPAPSEAAATLYFSVQERGPDASAASASVQSHLAALQAALQAGGASAGDMRVTAFNVFQNDSQGKQWLVSASLQTLVKSDQVSKATTAALQIPGITGYSTYPALGSEPAVPAVQAATAAATAQAKESAAGIAQAAGVGLGTIQSIVAQPPTVCGYGPNGPDRMVQVTLTYALR